MFVTICHLLSRSAVRTSEIVITLIVSDEMYVLMSHRKKKKKKEMHLGSLLRFFNALKLLYLCILKKKITG